jgi:hypothetical protein
MAGLADMAITKPAIAKLATRLCNFIFSLLRTCSSYSCRIVPDTSFLSFTNRNNVYGKACAHSSAPIGRAILTMRHCGQGPGKRCHALSLHHPEASKDAAMKPSDPRQSEPPPLPAGKGELPPDADNAEAMHRRHEDAETARHCPSETGAGKEGKPSKP